jgi:hypothetical protein
MLGFVSIFSRFGYMSNTKTKFIIVTETSNTQLQDTELRLVCIATSLKYCFKTFKLQVLIFFRRCLKDCIPVILASCAILSTTLATKSDQSNPVMTRFGIRLFFFHCVVLPKKKAVWWLRRVYHARKQERTPTTASTSRVYNMIITNSSKLR